jgi:hypothetical protein
MFGSSSTTKIRVRFGVLVPTFKSFARKSENFLSLREGAGAPIPEARRQGAR